MALLLHCTLGGELLAQTTAGDTGPLFALVPDEVSVRYMFKSSGNFNMVAAPDFPVVVSIVLTNATEEAHTIFITRYGNLEEDKPLDYPLGCAVRITDAKGNALLQHKEHADGYWSSLGATAEAESIYRKDSRNIFEVPAKSRRAVSINIATLLAGGTGEGWPVVDGKFLPGAYRFKFRWAGKESQEFSLTITSK